jgi:hypothetical protein
MPWDRLALAVVVAFVAALAFYPALRLPHRSRAIIWLGCSTIVGLSPCLISLNATPLRFLASLLAITLLVKLYDVHREVRLGLHLSLWSYLAYLPNGFWLVLRRKPKRPSMSQDLWNLGLRAPAALLSVIVCLMLLQSNWRVSFAFEHILKVSAVVSVVVLTGNAMAAVYRLLGGVALDFMCNPFLAPTPADFWRRWNVPAQQFFNEYAFKPAGGLRNPTRATLITFGVSGMVHEYVFGIAAGRVQGWQLLFFMVQGFAAVATMSIRPKGRIALLWIAGTWAFNWASSVFFFMSVDQIRPFYWIPGS